jgi:putative aminopeptidase FrvX
MAVPPLLTDLLTASGPSGREEEASRIWRMAASEFADVTSDTLGTSFARVRAGDGAPTLALVGHIDEIGVSITNVEESGLLSFTTVGGITPEALVAQRVDLLTRDGVVRGVIARSRIAPEKARDRPRLELTDLHIDIGARDRADAAARVRVGDSGVWIGEPIELPNGRLVSKALDNRLGSYIVLEAARRLGESPAAAVDVVAVAATQEELGSLGAGPAAFALDPLVALVVDVTYTTDIPGGDARSVGRVELDGGTAIAVGPTLNRRVTDLLIATAEEEDIAHAFEVYTRQTMTDADEIHLSKSGVPTGLLSIPTRYLHSPSELCSLADVEATVQLIVAFARRLERDQSFVR